MIAVKKKTPHNVSIVMATSLEVDPLFRELRRVGDLFLISWYILATSATLLKASTKRGPDQPKQNVLTQRYWW